MIKIYSTLLAGTVVLCANAQKGENYHRFPTERNGFSSSYKSYAPLQTKAAGDTIFSDDFSDASKWTFTDNSTPAMVPSSYSIGNNLPTGTFSSELDPIKSTTTANGYALIDSDAGYTNAPGTQDLKLTLNQTLDFSTKQYVAINFQSFHRCYRDSILIEFNVNGAGWNHQIRLDRDIDVNESSANPTFQSVNISSIVGNQSNVQFRFRYKGEWDYAWFIDDLAFVEPLVNELLMTQVYQKANGDGGMDYYAVSKSQVSFPGTTFGAKVNNQGAVAQNAASLSVKLNGGAAVLGNAKAIDVAATDSLTLETPIMLVAGTNTFQISQDLGGVVDDNPSNNMAQLTIVKGGDEYSRHDGVRRGGFNFTTATQGMRACNIYDIYDPISIKSVKARITGAASNVDDEIFSEIYLFNTNTNDWDFLARVDMPFTTAHLTDYMVFDFSDDIELLKIPANSSIQVWVGHEADPTPVIIASAQETIPQISLVEIGGGTQGFVLNAPMISVVEYPASGVGLTELTNGTEFTLSPNPTKDLTTLSLSLEKAGDVTVRVIDVTGKVVYTSNNQATAGQNNFQVPVSTLNSGLYTVEVVTATSKGTKKLLVNN